MDESDEIEKKETLDNRKEEDHKDKKVGPKTLGKFYKTEGHITPDEGEGNSDGSSGEDGECFAMGGQTRPLPECCCCGITKHHLHGCRKFFLVLTLKERVSFAKQEGICLKCLRYDHTLPKCPFKNKPDCRFCASQEHHYLLCPDPEMGVVAMREGVEEVITGYGLENIGELIARKNVSTLQLT